jgi:anti-sigma28 factor (negative regulator of flagellin synthesis)
MGEPQAMRSSEAGKRMTVMQGKKKPVASPATERQLKILLKALLRLGSEPEVRREKVQALSQAVRTKTYQVDVRKLADCLINSLLFGLLR